MLCTARPLAVLVVVLLVLSAPRVLGDEDVPHATMAVGATAAPDGTTKAVGNKAVARQHAGMARGELHALQMTLFNATLSPEASDAVCSQCGIDMVSIVHGFFGTWWRLTDAQLDLMPHPSLSMRHCVSHGGVDRFIPY